MSALPPKADIAARSSHVCFTPKAGHSAAQRTLPTRSEQSLEQQHLDFAAAPNLAARSDTKLRGKRPQIVYQDAWQEAGTGASASDL